MTEEIGLKNQVAIVTGGASGIGLAATQKFLGNGIETFVFDINNDMEKSFKDSIKSDTYHNFFQVDVTSHESIINGFKKINEIKKNASILVNCAGISPPLNALHDYDVNDWKKCIDINLTGTFLMCKEFMKQFLDNKLSCGSIINVSSIMGKRASAAQAVYSATKHGVVGLTKSIAQDYASFNLRANAIGPGAVETPMVEDIKDDKMIIDLMNSRIPLKRFGQPEEIANLIYFLANNDSSYITGSYIPIDGGYLAS